VIRFQLAVHYNVCTGRAQVTGAPFTRAVPTQELYLNGNWKVLRFAHCFRRLAMHHHSAVAICPSGTSFGLFSRETVFDRKKVMRIGCFVEEVPELLIEGIVLIVRNYDLTILYPKGVSKVISIRVSTDLGCPSIQVFTIEKLNPWTLVLCLQLHDRRKYEIQE
jgi:hypothetical protein